MEVSQVDKYSNIKLLVIDVDGTMTDGGIYYDEFGNETKKFCTKDAAGFFAAHEAGLQIMVLTGRECKAVSRRMEELKVDCICQNVRDKYTYLKKYMEDKGYSVDNIGYIGDDLNDYKPMQLAVFRGCPKDSCQEVIGIADYISPINGGYGAVRDIICHLLNITGNWMRAIDKVYDLELIKGV